MGQILHGSTTTTYAVRTAIQRSKAPLKELAAQYGLNQKTVAKWRRRAFVHDAPMGAKPPFMRHLAETTHLQSPDWAESQAVSQLRAKTPARSIEGIVPDIPSVLPVVFA